MFKLFNTRKLIGLLISIIGVLMVRANPFESGTSPALYTKMLGVMIACAGIAVFVGGIKQKIEKRIRICPHCFKKNDAENTLCRTCKKPMTKNPQE